MTMKTQLIACARACACAMTAAVAFAPMAEAGGGVRLGFGGPLGTFTAMPSKSTVPRPAIGTRKVHVPHRNAARKTRHTPSIREAARKPNDAPIRTASKATRTEIVDEAPRTKIAKAHVETEMDAPPTGSSALLHAAIPDTDTGHDVATDEPETGAAPGERTGSEATNNANETAERIETCSKFIPAVGMTVTVECNE